MKHSKELVWNADSILMMLFWCDEAILLPRRPWWVDLYAAIRRKPTRCFWARNPQFMVIPYLDAIKMLIAQGYVKGVDYGSVVVFLPTEKGTEVARKAISAHDMTYQHAPWNRQDHDLFYGKVHAGEIILREDGEYVVVLDHKEGGAWSEHLLRTLTGFLTGLNIDYNRSLPQNMGQTNCD